jgi:hypothetical protein
VFRRCLRPFPCTSSACLTCTCAPTAAHVATAASADGGSTLCAQQLGRVHPAGGEPSTRINALLDVCTQPIAYAIEPGFRHLFRIGRLSWEKIQAACRVRREYIPLYVECLTAGKVGGNERIRQLDTDLSIGERRALSRFARSYECLCIRFQFSVNRRGPSGLVMS